MTLDQMCQVLITRQLTAREKLECVSIDEKQLGGGDPLLTAPSRWQISSRFVVNKTVGRPELRDYPCDAVVAGDPPRS
jgi:hypothetical protein